MGRDVGDEERYCVGDTVPLIRAAALGEELDLSGDEREEKKFLVELMPSEAKERTGERPGTVLMGEEEEVVPLQLAITVLYGKGEVNILREDLGEAGGVMPLSNRGLPPPEAVIGEVLADNAASPFIDTGSRAFFPGEARGLGVTWTGYWPCWTMVFIGDEIVL